jgi:hypothetical protein
MATMRCRPWTRGWRSPKKQANIGNTRSSFAAKGEILLQRDATDPAPAEDAYRSAIAIAKEQGARSYELLAALALAELYQSTARPAEAHAVLAPTLEGFLPRVEMLEIAAAQALLTALGAPARAARRAQDERDCETRSPIGLCAPDARRAERAPNPDSADLHLQGLGPDAESILLDHPLGKLGAALRPPRDCDQDCDPGGCFASPLEE